MTREIVWTDQRLAWITRLRGECRSWSDIGDAYGMSADRMRAAYYMAVKRVAAKASCEPVRSVARAAMTASARGE